MTVAVPSNARLAEMLTRISFTGLASVTAEAEPYLIDGFLSSTATIIAGDPKAGKTTLVAGAVAALLRGDESFLGLAVTGHLGRVVFGVTDAGARSELRKRFHGLGLDDRIDVFDAALMESDDWPLLAEYLVAQKVDLYVHDNVGNGLGLAEDIAEARTARLVVERFKAIQSRGVTVLLVTHTAKGNQDGRNTASAPIGGRPFAAWPRSVAVVRRSEDKGTRLRVESNLSAPLELPLHVEFDGDVPRWTLGQPAERKRREARQSKEQVWVHAVERIIAEQPDATSINALATWLGEMMPELGRPQTLRKKLPDWVTWTGATWERTDP